MRFSVSKKRSLPRRWLTVILSLCLLGGLFWIVESHMKPTLLTIAETRATQIATQTINNVINDKVSKEVNSQNLITIKVDDRGRVVFIQPNAMEFNKLAADTTIKVQSALKVIAA